MWFRNHSNIAHVLNEFNKPLTSKSARQYVKYIFKKTKWYAAVASGYRIYCVLVYGP